MDRCVTRRFRRSLVRPSMAGGSDASQAALGARVQSQTIRSVRAILSVGSTGRQRGSANRSGWSCEQESPPGVGIRSGRSSVLSTTTQGECSSNRANDPTKCPLMRVRNRKSLTIKNLGSFSTGHWRTFAALGGQFVPSDAPGRTGTVTSGQGKTGICPLWPPRLGSPNQTRALRLTSRT